MSEPVGIIYPPPELRGIVDSTAKYVAKNGEAFEERIKRENGGKPKFSFLLPDDPFNAYYQYKVKDIRNQILVELEQQEAANAQRPETPNNHEDESQEAQYEARPISPPKDTESITNGREVEHDQNSYNNQQEVHIQDHNNEGEVNATDGAPRVRLRLNEYIQEMTMRLEEPPPLNHLATSAPSITHMDNDIIKLTSQFIAMHGREFFLVLRNREHDNSQFDFLKAPHGQYSYMTNLIMQYALIQNQPLDILEQLEKDSSSQKHVLDKIKMRAEWNRMLELEQKKREEAEEKEKLLYSQIDWHDFVIVETIDYQPDERGEYEPTTADQVGTRLLIQQRYEEQNVPEEMEIDMDVESDQEQEKNEEETNEEANKSSLYSDQVVIRKDYDPKQVVKVTQMDNYFVSPITGQPIPVDQINDHVRYNLADPKYIEKKDQMLQERMNEEAVFASGSQIQNSLKNLAERRTDIFGVNDKETAIGRRIGEEQEQPKDDRIIWDGHKSSLKKKKLG